MSNELTQDEIETAYKVLETLRDEHYSDNNMAQALFNDAHTYIQLYEENFHE